MGSTRRIGAVFVGAALFGLAMAAIKGQGAGVRDALGNISAPWLLLAFIAGATTTRLRSAAVLGTVASLSALAAFYVAESRILNLGSHPWPVDLKLAVTAGRIYMATALISGPVFGLLGGIWHRRRSFLIAVTVAAMFVLEPIAVWLVEHAEGATASSGLLTQYPWMWIAEVILGLVAGAWLVSAPKRTGARQGCS